MSDTKHRQVNELLQSIKPWFSKEDAFLVDLAKQQWDARLAIAAALLESGQAKEAELLLVSIADAPEESGGEGQEQARIRAFVELAHLRMEQLKYDEAEELLWKARQHEASRIQDDFAKEDISLLIAQCRFGQGFIQEAIDRAMEILRKQQADRALSAVLAKTYQQLGWFVLHKADVPAAMAHMKQAMKLAPALDRALVDAGLEAEQSGDFEKAMEYYFDSIQFE